MNIRYPIYEGVYRILTIELQKDGLCGHLGEISAWLQKENNAWLKNGGEWGVGRSALLVARVW